MRLHALLLLLPFLFTACREEAPSPPPAEIPFRVDGSLDFLRPDSSVITRIGIEIAENDSARARGLMERRTLPDRGGMLFIMDRTEEQTFWMRNTPLPLDLVFVDDSLRIVSITERTRPLSDAAILSGEPARYVVEVRAGFVQRHGIEPGGLIRWRREAVR